MEIIAAIISSIIVTAFAAGVSWLAISIVTFALRQAFASQRNDVSAEVSLLKDSRMLTR